MNKSLIRKHVLKIREGYPEEFLKKVSFWICKKIESLDFYQKAQIVGFYLAKDKEVSLNYLIGKAFLKNKKIFLPKIWIKKNI